MGVSERVSGLRTLSGGDGPPLVNRTKNEGDKEKGSGGGPRGGMPNMCRWKRSHICLNLL